LLKKNDGGNPSETFSGYEQLNASALGALGLIR